MHGVLRDPLEASSSLSVDDIRFVVYGSLTSFLALLKAQGRIPDGALAPPIVDVNCPALGCADARVQTTGCSNAPCLYLEFLSISALRTTNIDQLLKG